MKEDLLEDEDEEREEKNLQEEKNASLEERGSALTTPHTKRLASDLSQELNIVVCPFSTLFYFSVYMYIVRAAMSPTNHKKSCNFFQINKK